MSKIPSMPFLVEKYLKKTKHLSLEEHGAYCLLLFHMWQAGGKLTDHDGDLARLLGISPAKWKKLIPRVGAFFQTYGGLLMQDRLQTQWNYAVENSAKNSEKASHAAKIMWEKRRGLQKITDVLQAMPQASPKHSTGDAILRKKDIPIPLSNTVGSEEIDQINREAIEKLHRDKERPVENLSRLLNTNLMKRSSAA